MNTELLLNILTHVYILLVFLSLIFFLYISQVSEKSINNEVQSRIEKEVPIFLSEIDKYDKFVGIVNWNGINKLGEDLEKNSQGNNPEDVNKNKLIESIVFGVCVGGGVLLLCFYLYYIFVKKDDISSKKILFENFVVFIFVGLIEYIFFTKIVSKYIPVGPDIIISSVINSIQDRIQIL